MKTNGKKRSIVQFGTSVILNGLPPTLQPSKEAAVNHFRNKENDIVLDLFPEAKRQSHFFPLLSAGIALLCLLFFASLAKAQEIHVGLVLPDAVFCETEAQVLEYLNVGSHIAYDTESLPEIQGCTRASVSIPVAWSDKQVFEDRYARAVIIEIEVPMVGTRYTYRDYVPHEGQEI